MVNTSHPLPLDIVIRVVHKAVIRSTDPVVVILAAHLEEQQTVVVPVTMSTIEKFGMTRKIITKGDP